MPPQLARAQRKRGRRKSQPRTVLEELPVLDARWLARKKMFPRGHYEHRHDMRIDNPVIDWLILGPRAAEIVFVDGTAQETPINWLRISGMRQSVRPAFECPGCGRNAFKLFYYDGWFSGCYRCIGVPYASQQRSRKGRSRLQAARLRMFLSSLPDETKTPTRQPLMFRRTYARFINRLQMLEAKARSRRRQKAITKQVSYKLLKPITAYNSQRHAIV